LRNLINVTLLLFFLFISVSIAQTHTLTGSVIGGFNKPIEFANVYLLKTSDSTLIYGASASELGTFEITGVRTGNYLLQASYLSKTSVLLSLEVIKNLNVHMVQIAEFTENLAEVTVSFKQPSVERKADRLVFNVENSAIAQGSSWDILKRTPGVIIMQGEIKIKNKSADVYINDRKVYLTSQELQQLLEGLTGENIKSVEVITNPPAKYDAEGVQF
jgi:hypothetical protein